MNIVPSDSSAFPAIPDRSPSLLVRIASMRFVVVSIVLHGLLILTFGGTILFRKLTEPPDFTGDAGSLLQESLPQPPPDQPLLQQVQLTPNVPTPTALSPPSSIAAITTTAPAPMALSIPVIAPVRSSTQVASLAQPALRPPSMSGGLSKEIATGIAGFTSGWTKRGSGGPGSSMRNREFEFTAYLAKYSGGDWNSTVRVANNEIIGGSLPNLLFVIGKLSRDKIDARPQAVPLDLGSDEIFAKKPPFIWFTGHRDFKLTDKEVENLQRYIRLGGCIWGDSSLPGQRSRFDIAFRREMRRVIADVDKPWRTVPLTHPIFTNAYYPDIREVPPGINFYREPIYFLESYGGEIGVIYTANDYGDMWQFGIDEHGKIDLRRDEKHKMVAVNEPMWNRREVFYRNIEPKALLNTYKFGTNIVVHLLTRWEDKVRNVPQGL